MAVGISSLADLGTSSAEYALGFGLGVALGRALGPLATSLEQEAYAADPSRALSPDDAARIVAQALEQLPWGQSEAAASGIAADKFALLEQAELRAPTVGELLQLIRRSEVSDGEVAHALRKAQLEPVWDDRIRGLAAVALTPAEVATAIHRNIIPGPGLIVVSPPTTPGSVEQVPQSQIDPVEQSSWWGIDREQLRVMVGITGLPLSLTEMLRLLNLGMVTEDDFKRSVAQSNLRNEYMDVALGLRRRLLTVREYAEAELRGVLEHAAAQAGAGLSGLEADDYVTLFETVGRPLNVHAMTTGLARGGKFGGTYADVPEPYQDAIRRSNVRPEYARLAYANRYSYPSAFVIRALATGGELDEPTTKQILLDIGWPPDLVDKVVTAWFGGTAAAADKHVAKAAVQLWTAAHKAYVDDRMTDALAGELLPKAGVDHGAVAAVLSLWQAERSIYRAGLTAIQVKKAIGQPGRDEAWALARLGELGYSPDDAAALLAE